MATMEEERLDDGFVREWSPCTRLLGLLPPRVQAGLFSTELRLTCIDAVEDYLALGTNVGLIYWYSRKNGTIERLRCEASQCSVTYVKVVNTVDYMVAAGNSNGQVTVFQIPKELPESVPDALRPKTDPKVERYTVGELHRSKITSIEWSKNGMRLFSGDKNGVIIMTEIDFYMHLCKSVEIVNEQYEVVQISYHQNSLLVSTVYRTILCEKKDAKWEVNQVGKKERKSLCALGAVFQWSYARGGAGEVAAYCARPGLRLWRADKTGDVHQTLLFKDAISNPMTIAELLNPSHTKHSQTSNEYQFGPLHIFRDNFIVTHNKDILYILDPRSLTAVAVVDDLRRILSVSVNKDEIFILEGERSLVRLGYAPEIDALNTGEDPLNAMTKSLSTSIQMAVNTVRDLAHMEPVAPFLTSVLEQPAASFTYTYEPQDVANAEECFELPPVRQLPPDVAVNVLESMIDSFKAEEVKKTNIDDLQRKVRMYNNIVEPKCDRELIFSSKRNKKREPTSANNTPWSTPVRRGNMIQKTDGKEENGVSYTSPCIVTTDYKHSADESDEEMIKQIEEKEKILAKMLNLESLSIPLKQSPEPHVASPEPERRQLLTKPTLEPPMPTSQKTDIMTRSYPVTIRTPKREPIKESPSIRALEDVVPKLAKVPPNWNLGSLRVTLDSLDSEGVPAEHLASPDGIESEWEFI